MMNRDQNRTNSRRRAKAVPLAVRNWWPEACGAMLLLIAALQTANLIA